MQAQTHVIQVPAELALHGTTGMLHNIIGTSSKQTCPLQASRAALQQLAGCPVHALVIPCSPCTASPAYRSVGAVMPVLHARCRRRFLQSLVHKVPAVHLQRHHSSKRSQCVIFTTAPKQSLRGCTHAAFFIPRHPNSTSEPDPKCTYSKPHKSPCTTLPQQPHPTSLIQGTRVEPMATDTAYSAWHSTAPLP